MKNTAHISAAAQTQTKIVPLRRLERQREGKDGQKSGAALSLLPLHSRVKDIKRRVLHSKALQLAIIHVCKGDARIKT